MEILFLLVGLIFIAIGVVIVFSEVQARRGTQPVRARVTGFSTGRATTERIPSFYSVAQYTGPDGREYYVEGVVGSSAPLHAVGDSVAVLVSLTQPEKAVFKDHEGHDHEFVDSFSSDPPSYHAGQKVSVLYNRENPREAQIDRGRANYWLALLLGLLGVLFTSLGFFSAGRRRHG